VEIDYLNPNYTAILKARADRLVRLRSDPKFLAASKIHYKTNPWDFIRDWGVTFEPRNIEIGRPAVIPFVPFKRQEEFVRWIYEHWRARERGLAEKSRDFGASWLTVGFCVSMFLFHDGFTAGIGSRKEALVDKKGDPKAIFEKIRFFIKELPRDFWPIGWNEREHTSFLKITNPENGATITGEAGDDIGRGARMSIYFVDEAAFIQRQDSVDSALSQTTNCQIDISTPNGNGNLFFKKRHGGKIPVFVMDWREDPRKNQAWYQQQVEEQDSVTVAQEIDRNYNASKENIFIPAAWVKAAVDAHIKLGFEPEGMKRTSFDPADVGDARGHMFMHGVVIVEAIEQKQGDITHAIAKASDFADDCGAEELIYDADGMGAPVVKVGLAGKIGTRTNLVPFYGSGAVENPDKKSENGKTNKERYYNFRAQSMWRLRDRFHKTYNAVENGKYTDPSQLISISSKCTSFHKLVSELSRAERQYSGDGKIKVESKQNMEKRGVDSPNLSDCAMMLSKPPVVLREQPPMDYSKLHRATAGSPMRRAMR